MVSPHGVDQDVAGCSSERYCVSCSFQLGVIASVVHSSWVLLRQLFISVGCYCVICSFQLGVIVSVVHSSWVLLYQLFIPVGCYCVSC